MISKAQLAQEAQEALNEFGDLYTDYVATYATYVYNPGTGTNVLVASYQHVFKAVYTKPNIVTISQSGNRIQYKDLFLTGMYKDILTNAFEGRGVRIGDKIIFPSGNLWEVVDITWDSAEATATIQVR